MSSRPASGSTACPHCDVLLDRSLAQHMTLGECDGHEPSTPPTATRSTSDLPERYDELPIDIDDHDERDHEPIDIDERRDLADELTEAGVWC